MTVVFPEVCASPVALQSSLLSTPPRRILHAPYFEHLRQVHIGLSMVPDVLVATSREPSPAEEARVEELRLRITRDVNSCRTGDYPRLVCTSLSGPFLHALDNSDRDNDAAYIDREWSPFPADEDEAAHRGHDVKRKAKVATAIANLTADEPTRRSLRILHSTKTVKTRSPVRRTSTWASEHLEHELIDYSLSKPNGSFSGSPTGIVTPPVSSGEENGFSFAPQAVSTQPVQRLLPSPSSPSPASVSRYVSASQPEVRSISPSPQRASQRASASQPKASTRKRTLTDLYSPKRSLAEALPRTPARKKMRTEIPITPVSAQPRTSSNGKGKGKERAAPEREQSPTPLAKRLATLPHFTELASASARKRKLAKRRSLPKPIETSMSFTPPEVVPPDPTPTPPEAMSNNSLRLETSSSPAGYGQQDMDDVRLGDIAPSQIPKFDAADGEGWSQGDLDMLSSSQAGVAAAVEERVRGLGRFLERDAWKF